MFHSLQNLVQNGTVSIFKRKYRGKISRNWWVREVVYLTKKLSTYVA